MRLLRCIWSLDPALGGVQEAVRQTCLGLSELGHSVEIVCLDEPEAAWLRGYPAKVHALGPVKLSVRSASLVPYGYSGRYIRWMRERAEKYDAVIIDGLWQFPSLGAWLALRGSRTPYFVYTHNMLDPWFKETYPAKHAKKWLYWLLVERKVLKDARAVLYLSEQEKVLARQSFRPFQAKEAVVGLSIGVSASDPLPQRQLFLDRFPELRDKRLILFLGRIHYIKGCDFLIEAFAKVSHIDSSLHLVFAGPDPVNWQQELQRRVAELGLESRISWTGMLLGDLKWGALHAAEAFVLPSRSEGFPVAAIEAMGCGVPVLISDQVRIWPEVQETGGGFIGRDDVSGITEVLERWLQLPPDKRESMKRRAQEGYFERFAPEVALERFVSTLREFGVTEIRSSPE